MKLLKKVNRVDVKRCFAITHFMRKFGVGGKSGKRLVARDRYLLTLHKSKQALRTLSKIKLDKIVGAWKKRLHAYDGVDWYLGNVLTKEVGVWKGAGGLPTAWTRGSLSFTATKVRIALRNGGRGMRKRSKRAIPSIIELQDIIKSDKYLLPIIFQSGAGTNGRRGLLKMKGDIDDGCMRSIAFAVTGDKNIKAYIGVPKK